MAQLRNVLMPRHAARLTAALLTLLVSVFWVVPETSKSRAYLQPSGEHSLTGRRSVALAGLLSPLVLGNDAHAITQEELRVASLFLCSSPSVIGIGEQPTRGRKAATAGSGFVWDGSHVVTNYHVISDLQHPHVTFLTKDSDGIEQHTTLSACVVGADPLSDIAVLEVAIEDGQANLKQLMRPLPRGISAQLKPGQEVFALGNPYGLEHSMSRGIVSGVSRKMEGQAGRPMNGIIQTDASINPGNSGGPLLDTKGAVVGINTAILSMSGSFQGVGFAVPIDTVTKNVNSMLSEGYVSRPSLGVVFAPDEMSRSLGVGGAMVLKVLPGGPAQRAGLRALRGGQLGDVIVSLGGRPVGSAGDVFTLLDQRAPGEDVTMSVQRASADENSDQFDVVDLTVRLGRSNSKLVVT